MIPLGKAEGPPTPEGPSQEVVTGRLTDHHHHHRQEEDTPGGQGREEITPNKLPPAMIRSEHSIVVLVAASDKRMHRSTLKVLINLCGRADKHGECFPSYDRIAAEAAADRRTAINSVKWLEKHHYLVRTLRYVHGTEKVRQTSNRYRVSVPHDLPPDHPYARFATGVVVAPSLRGWPTDHQGGGVGTTLNYSKEHTPNNNSKELEQVRGEEQEIPLEQERSDEQRLAQIRAQADAFKAQRDRRLAAKGGRLDPGGRHP